MRADITEDGLLRIIPETPIEKYACQAWLKEWNPLEGGKSRFTIEGIKYELVHPEN